MRRVLVGAVCLFVGCRSTPTSVLLQIEAAAGVPAVDRLELSIYDESGVALSGQRLPPCEGTCADTTVELPDEVVLYPPVESGILRILVTAMTGDTVGGQGATSVTLRPGDQVQATVTLEIGCLPDRDGDGVPDEIDNCPDVPNPDQEPCAGPDLGVDGPPVVDGQPDTGPGRDGPEPDVGPGPDGPEPDVAPKPDVGPVIPGTWVAIQAGTFTMGSPTSELCRDPDETEHQVTLSQDFEIMTTAATQADFQAVMGYDPSSYSSCGSDCPVERVTWHEAAAFCNALSSIAQLTLCYDCTGSGGTASCSVAASFIGKAYYTCPGYRLPTEAEHEYAHRANTTTPFYNGSIASCTGTDANGSAIGWYNAISGGTTHPVAKKLANAWGLYDMAGNTYDWCVDWFATNLGTAAVTDPVGPSSGVDRVIRGGCHALAVRYLRAANRANRAPGAKYDYVGVRCVRTK